MFSRITYPGINFNDNLNFIVDGIPGLSGPPIRRESFDMPQANFGIYVASYYGQRAFSLDGMIVGSDPGEFANLRDQLSTAFNAFTGEQPLVFEYVDRPSRQIMAVASGEVQFDPTTEAPFACTFHIPMVAAFPFLTSNAQSTATLLLSQIGGGTVPATLPMSLSMNVGGSNFIINSGTAPAYPTVRIIGPVTNPSLRNMTTGEDLLFLLELAEDEYIDIDLQLHTVTDNTGRGRYGSVRGKWWKLDTGTSEIRFVADSTDSAANAVLDWSSTYLNA